MIDCNDRKDHRVHQIDHKKWLASYVPASNKYNNQNVKAVKPRPMSAYIGIKTYEQDGRQPIAK